VSLGTGSFCTRGIAPAEGVGYEQLAQLVSALTAVPLQAMAGAGKQRQGVRARSLLCYWAVSELGMSLTDLSGRLKVSVPTVSIAVQRGMKIAEHEKLDIGLLAMLRHKGHTPLHITLRRIPYVKSVCDISIMQYYMHIELG